MPNDRCRPSSAEKVSTTHSTPGARSAGGDDGLVPREVEDRTARAPRTRSAERNAVRVRNSIARSFRATSHAAPSMPGGCRSLTRTTIARYSPDTSRASSDAAGSSRRTMRPASITAACDATASPSSTLCVTSISAAPAARSSVQHLRERRAAGRVEARVRLVEQHDRRLVHDRARDRDALLQSAAQRAHRRVARSRMRIRSSARVAARARIAARRTAAPRTRRSRAP